MIATRPTPPADRAGRALDLLRILLGLIWAVNLVFIFLPAADYWGSFSVVARSYGPTSLGGEGLANFVAGHPTFFASLIAAVSVYLALALLLGFTTRLACVVGFMASTAFLVTQWNATFFFPGGTDVGAHPLYLIIYLALFLGGAGRYGSVDAWIWSTGRARWRRISHWIATPSVVGVEPAPFGSDPPEGPAQLTGPV